MIFTKNHISIDYDPTKRVYKVRLEMRDPLNTETGAVTGYVTERILDGELIMTTGGCAHMVLPDNILIGVKDDE